MDLTLTAPIDEYLSSSPLIDVDHVAVRAQAQGLRNASAAAMGQAERDGSSTGPPSLSLQQWADIAFIRAAYEFVRDDVSHSWDIQSTRVTAKASDVLQYREGICYAKSLLLSALLRSQGVPSGIGYQRLVLFDDPADGYCLHALNTVYLEFERRWIRLDARGNNDFVDAQFSLDEERLAFPVRPEMGEIDYPYNFAAPPEVIVDTLLGHVDCREMYACGLPSDLAL